MRLEFPMVLGIGGVGRLQRRAKKAAEGIKINYFDELPHASHLLW